MAHEAKPSFFPHLFAPEAVAVANLEERTECSDFNVRWTDCLAAYGIYNGKKKCQDFYDDVVECNTARKRLLRMNLMMKERLEQQKKKGREYISLPRKDLL